ncbi:MAG: thioesterase [Planctomycetota bacterium]
MSLFAASPGSFHETRTEVRYAETDQMGYAHHSVAVSWFELGRVTWMRDIGCPYRDIERRGVLMPVVKLELTYHAPARFEDQLGIRTRLLELRRATVIFENRIERIEPEGRRTLLVVGRVELACVDAAGKVQRMPKDLQAAFEPYLPPTSVGV